MLAIKLSRFGKKKQPLFRLVVLEKTADPWGDYLENLGTMNPRAKDKDIKFDLERIKYWIEKGAQPTDTVRNILIDLKIIKGEKARTIRMSKERTARINEAKGIKEEPKVEVKAEAKPAEAPSAEAKPAEAAPAEAPAAEAPKA